MNIVYNTSAEAGGGGMKSAIFWRFEMLPIFFEFQLNKFLNFIMQSPINAIIRGVEISEKPFCQSLPDSLPYIHSLQSSTTR